MPRSFFRKWSGTGGVR